LRVAVSENGVTTTTEFVTISRLSIELTTPSLVAAGTEETKFFNFGARLVRSQIHGPRVASRQVLIGGETQAALATQTTRQSRAKSLLDTNPNLVTAEQFQGDYLILNNEASLAIYEIRHNGSVVAEALRYRQPSSMFLTVTGKGTDVMLYRRS
jgi:hypothetical protein